MISFCIIPDLRPRFVLDKECVHSLLHFGKWILVGTVLTFLATQSDRLILGKLISLEALGVYGVAFALSDMPRQIIAMFCGRRRISIHRAVCAATTSRIPQHIREIPAAGARSRGIGASTGRLHRGPDLFCIFTTIATVRRPGWLVYSP